MFLNAHPSASICPLCPILHQFSVLPLTPPPSSPPPDHPTTRRAARLVPRRCSLTEKGSKDRQCCWPHARASTGRDDFPRHLVWATGCDRSFLQRMEHTKRGGFTCLPTTVTLRCLCQQSEVMDIKQQMSCATTFLSHTLRVAYETTMAAYTHSCCMPWLSQNLYTPNIAKHSFPPDHSQRLRVICFLQT